MDRVKTLATSCKATHRSLSSSSVLSSFAACSCRSEEFQALLQQEPRQKLCRRIPHPQHEMSALRTGFYQVPVIYKDLWRGLQMMLYLDARLGNASWLEAVRLVLVLLFSGGGGGRDWGG